jgi:hypothetical protein
MAQKKTGMVLFTATAIAAWGLFAVANEGSSRNPCERAPTETQVEQAVHRIPEVTEAVVGPLEFLANRVRDDHSLRERYDMDFTNNSAIYNGAVQILQFVREARTLSQSLSNEAALGRPTARDATLVYRIRRLLNRADAAFTLIMTTWPDYTQLRRDVWGEYSASLRPYREMTYKIMQAQRCQSSYSVTVRPIVIGESSPSSEAPAEAGPGSAGAAE